MIRKLMLLIFKKWLRQELVYYSGWTRCIGAQFDDPKKDDFDFVDCYMRDELNL